MIPLRACRGGAAEKRMGEPSEATPVGARNSSSSLRVRGRNREGRRCEDFVCLWLPYSQPWTGKLDITGPGLAL